MAMDVVDSMMQADIDFRAISVNYKPPENIAEKVSSLKRLNMPYLPVKEDYQSTAMGVVKYFLKKAQSTYYGLVLDSQLRRNPPELMIFNDSDRNSLSVRNRYGKQSKIIDIIHESPNFVDKYFEIGPVCYLNRFRDSDSVVFVSDQCRKAWLEYGILEEEKVHYIPNCAKEHAAKGYLEKTKTETREKLELSRDTFYLVSVASVQPRKGQDLLIDAAPELKKIAPNLEILIIGGRGGEFSTKLEEKARHGGLDFVKFMGRKPNAMEYIYASDAFILTSRAEAFPLVLLEAMILNTPMIGSNVDGVPEMIEHKKTGLLFESENVDEIVQCFTEMYNEKEKRQQYTEQASDKYWRDFSKEKFTKRYLDCIDQLRK